MTKLCDAMVSVSWNELWGQEEFITQQKLYLCIVWKVSENTFLCHIIPIEFTFSVNWINHTKEFLTMSTCSVVTQVTQTQTVHIIINNNLSWDLIRNIGCHQTDFVARLTKCSPQNMRLDALSDGFESGVSWLWHLLGHLTHWPLGNLNAM